MDNVVSFRSDSAGDAIFCGDEVGGGEGAVVEDGNGVAVDGFEGALERRRLGWLCVGIGSQVCMM